MNSARRLNSFPTPRQTVPQRRRWAAWALAAMTLGTAPAGAAVREFSVPQLEALGRAIYEQNRRTRIASDVMHENYDAEKMGINGWVTEGDPAHLLVRFVHRDATGATAVLDAKFDELLLPEFAPPASPALTPAQAAQVAARETAEPHLSNPCETRYDNAVVPDPDGSGFLVYAIALANARTDVMLGGHRRFTVSADGTTFEHDDALTTSCLSAPLDKLQQSDGTKGVAVRANLSNTPLEIHVYLSLLYKIPLYVVTRDLKMWKVENGTMHVIHNQPGPAPTAGQ